MNSNVFYRISIVVAILIVGFVAIYARAIYYEFPNEQINYLFALFYLILTLNYLGLVNVGNSFKDRLDAISKNIYSIFITCLIIIIFGILLLSAGFGLLKITLILLSSLFIYSLLFLIVDKKITLYLFWLQFYLFMGTFIFAQIPNVQIDMLSKFNPLGGLVITLFG